MVTINNKTKWARDNQSNVDRLKERMKDQPVVISKEEFESREDDEDSSITYYCNHCRRNLLRLGYNDYYCNFCHTSAAPLTDVKKPQRSQNYEPNQDTEDSEAYVSYLPENNDDDYDKVTGKKKAPVLKSGLDSLRRGTIRITKDLIMDGSGKIIKSENKSSGYSSGSNSNVRSHAKGPYPSSKYRDSGSETDTEDVIIEELEEVEE
jgi:hypothetical protein